MLDGIYVHMMIPETIDPKDQEGTFVEFIKCVPATQRASPILGRRLLKRHTTQPGTRTAAEVLCCSWCVWQVRCVETEGHLALHGQ